MALIDITFLTLTLSENTIKKLLRKFVQHVFF